MIVCVIQWGSKIMGTQILLSPPPNPCSQIDNCVHICFFFHHGWRGIAIVNVRGLAISLNLYLVVVKNRKRLT